MSAASKRLGKFCFQAALAALIVLSGALSPLSAQDQQQPQQQVLSEQELGQLVAPIALYPDALLAQVLTASTYPLEVVMAARWSEKNPNLKGAALENAMQKQPWEPSVKGLTAVPQVLAMMNDKLDWTQQLGEAFLAQPDDVQNAIQALRAKADAAGNLKSGKEQKVKKVVATPSPGYAGPPEYIVIEPVEPDYIYVPVYNPTIVFGIGYWSPAYTPFFWYPHWWTVGPVYGFGAPFLVGPALYYNYNWGGGGFAAIQVNPVYYSKFNKVQFVGDKAWKFKPEHHGKREFKNKALQAKFMGPNDKVNNFSKNDSKVTPDKLGKLQPDQGNKGKSKGPQPIKDASQGGAGGGKGSAGGGGGNKGIQADKGNKGSNKQVNLGNQGNKSQGDKGGKGNNKGVQTNIGNQGQGGPKPKVVQQPNQGNQGSGGKPNQGGGKPKKNAI
jgi:hypothetical protein